MSDDRDTWHPKIRQFHDYWQRIHPAPGVIPGRQHFDPLAIAPLLPNIWLVDVDRSSGIRFRYRLAGTRIVEALGYEVTGRWLDEVHADFGPQLRTYQDYVVVAEQKQLSWRRGKPVFMAYAEHCVGLERLLLPLARDGQTVDMVVALTILFDAQGEER